MWLWYTQPSTPGVFRISKIDTASGAIVQTYDLSTMFPATGSVGGLDVFNDHPEYPGRVVAAMVIQNFPASIVAVVDLGPDSTNVGPGGGSITINRNGLNIAIPDNGGNANPAVDSIVISGIPSGMEIKKIRVTIDTVIHTYIGDLRFWLNHTATAFDTIISRIGYTGTGFGNSCDNLTGTVLVDSTGLTNIQNIPTTCNGVLAQATGTFNPKAPLAPFQNSGTNPNGSYILRISDNAAADLGSLRAWSIKIDYDIITGVSNNVTSIAENYKLSQNYPNPFNPSTKINYSIPKSGLVSIKVYDVLGKEVYTLVNEIKNAGSYEALFNGANFSSGVYFYRIQAGDFVETKKMYLLK
jgi:subtilisin-like proprotein convertase family protein